MRLIVLAAAVAALTLSACGKKEAAPAAGGAPSPAPEQSAAAAPPAEDKKEVELPAGFPKMTASYKAVYKARMGEMGEREMTLEAAGARKLRFEMPHFSEERAAAGDKVVGVFDDQQNRSVMFVEGPGAKKVALVIPQEENMLASFLKWSSEDGAPPTKVGSDNVAGLSCDIWEAAADAGEAPGQACITRDGILLRAGDKGAEPDVVAVSVDKGARPSSSFALPEGYELLDMGPCRKLMEEAMAGAQSGKMPDMVAMQKCQDIGMKAGEIFGQ
ncbi:MAG: hypothetical protein HXY23_01810 [Parvularculaceae bacterium]|nr:hypothetical protein [Parvularculaceae bacterium]